MCPVFVGKRRTVSVVWVSPTTQEEAEENAASSDHKGPHQDVSQSDGPEGEQVNSLIAVNIDGGGVLHIDRLVNPVDPHVTSNEPTEDKAGQEGCPGGAEAVEGTGGAFFGLCTGQTGQQGQDQRKDPHHHQEDGDVVLPRALF